MKILHIINSLATGGAEKLIVETIPLYREKGIKADVLLLNGTEYPLYKELQETNCCRIYSLGKTSVYNPKLIGKIIPYLKQYDLIHVHLFPAQYFAIAAKRLAFSKKLFVFTEHSTSNRRFSSKKFKLADKIIYNSYSRIVCIAEKVKDAVLKQTGIIEEKLTVIENGINLGKINSAPPYSPAELNNKHSLNLNLMKLLYITNGITGAGGLERVLSVKASMLTEQFGYEVHILSLNEEGQQTFFEFSPQIVRHSMKVGGNPLRYLKAYKKGIQHKVKEINPDVISVCDDGLKGFFIPKILNTKTPVIYERHVSRMIEKGEGQNSLSGMFSDVKFCVMNHLAKSFDRFVVLTDGNIKEWNLHNIIVIPNPLPFYPNAPAALHNKKVIAVGKQGYQKAYDLLLASWAKLPVELKDWELHIYGKKEKSLQLPELAKKLGIAEKVFFHSPAKDIESKFLESSVFVLSSRFEGFGMVIIEAMACGLPVVSFDCPHGPADIITHGSDGLLVENGNTEDLARQLATLMYNSELRYQFGNAARETAKKYQAKEIIECWNQLFVNL